MKTIAKEKLSEVMILKNEVKEAIEEGRPVVALESTIISHGMPFPKNIETALEVEKIIREGGAVPATIAVLDGKIRVGLTEGELESIGKPGRKDILKLSRRDLPYAFATKSSGATTVAATMICAELAGISVFATGGIGGVHRDAEKTFDISADLNELAKSRVAVVCAGAKSILDIGLTLEVLETLGVPVVGYQTDVFPSFYSRKSAFSLEYRMDDVKQIAELMKYQWMIESSGGVLVANPIPVSDEMPSDLIEKYISEALIEATRLGVKGKGITPFLLSNLVSRTEGRTLVANIALIKNNAKLGAALAQALTQAL